MSFFTDYQNSSNKTLSSGGTFEGKWIDILNYDQCTVLLSSDVAGTLTLQYSTKKENIDYTVTQAHTSSSTSNIYTHGLRFFRVLYTNGASGQGNFLLRINHHIFYKGAASGVSFGSVGNAINNFAQSVSEGLYSNWLSYNVPGSQQNQTTSFRTLITNHASYPFPTTTTKLKIQSASADDNVSGTGARSVYVEGLDASWNIVNETFVPTGTSFTSLGSEDFIRINRCYVLTAGTYGGTNTGNIDIANSSSTDLHRIPGTEGQAVDALFSIPNNYKGLITNLSFVVKDGSFATIILYARENGDDVTAPYSPKKAIYSLYNLKDSLNVDLPVPLVVPAKTDVWAEGKVNSGSATLGTNFNIILKSTS